MHVVSILTQHFPRYHKDYMDSHCVLGMAGVGEGPLTSSVEALGGMGLASLKLVGRIDIASAVTVAPSSPLRFVASYCWL